MQAGEGPAVLAEGGGGSSRTQTRSAQGSHRARNGMEMRTRTVAFYGE